MIFVLGKTGSRDRKLINLKRCCKTFTQDTKAISNSIYPFVTLCDLSSFKPLILPMYWHQDEPLGCSVFADPN